MHTILLQSDQQFTVAIMALFLTVLPFLLVIAVIGIVSHWIIFTKAGKEGWEVLIPIYGTLVLLKIVGKPWWWILLLCIPFLNIIWAIWMMNMLSKSFGKDEGFTAGLVLLGYIFFPILAFSKAQYQGPFGDPVAYKAFQEAKHSFDFEQKPA